jgi:hypothetical protein
VLLSTKFDQYIATGDSTVAGSNILLTDHFEGFDSAYQNPILIDLNKNPHTVYTEYLFDDRIKSVYKNLKFQFDYKVYYKENSLYSFSEIELDPPNFDNFVCSFNGTEHISRQFLTSALYNQGWFNTDYCTKNFITNKDTVDGNVSSYCTPEEEATYRNVIVTEDDAFYKQKNDFEYNRYDHQNNLRILSKKISRSFVNIVSETLANSYYPFVTEKFLYSIVSNGLFVTYGQPGWHSHISQYYGFRLYNKIFDYSFDTIQNPIIRLVELLNMLNKFSTLSSSDWHDLFLLEKDTIDYNRDHWISGQALKLLEQYEQNNS